MWLNDLFWGIRITFLGKYHFFVINDHLWGPSVHVDQSFKKIQAGVRPPHPGNVCILGTSGPATPPLSIFSNKCWHFKKCRYIYDFQLLKKIYYFPKFPYQYWYRLFSNIFSNPDIDIFWNFFTDIIIFWKLSWQYWYFLKTF